MDLDYKRLKSTYNDLFQNNEKCDHVLTDVLFAYKEFYEFINDKKVSKVLDTLFPPQSKNHFIPTGQGKTDFSKHYTRDMAVKTCVGVQEFFSKLDNIDLLFSEFTELLN